MAQVMDALTDALQLTLTLVVFLAVGVVVFVPILAAAVLMAFCLVPGLLIALAAIYFYDKWTN